MSELYTAPPSPNPDYNNLIKLWKRLGHSVPRETLEDLRIMSEESPGKFKEYYNQWVYAGDTYGGKSKPQDIALNFDKVRAQYEYNQSRRQKGLDALDIPSLDWAPGRYDDTGNEALNAWYQENGYVPKGMQMYDFTGFMDEYARKKAERDAQPAQQSAQGKTDYETGTNNEAAGDTAPAFFISPDGTKSVSSKVKGGNYVITPLKGNLYVLQYVDGNGKAHEAQAYFGTYDGAQRAVSQIAPMYLKGTLTLEQLKKIAGDINRTEAAAGSPRAFILGYDDADSFSGIDAEGDKFYNPYSEKDGLVYTTAQGITNLLNWGDKAWKELTGAGDTAKILAGKMTPEETAEYNREAEAIKAAYIAKYGHLGPDATDTESTFVTSVSPEYAAMAGFADMGQGALFRPLEELVNAKAEASGSDTRLMNGAEALNRVHGAYPLETAIGTTASMLMPIGAGEKAAAVTLAQTSRLGAKTPTLVKMLRAGAPLGIYNGLRSVGEGNSADAVALNIVEGILAGAEIEGGMQILESLARTYLPKAGAALYEKWLAGGRKASVFSREAKEAMIKGLSGELRLAGKEYETVWDGVKDATPVNKKSVPSNTVNEKLTPDMQPSVPANGTQPMLYGDTIPSVKGGNPGVKAEDIIEPYGGKIPWAAGEQTANVPESSEKVTSGVDKEFKYKHNPSNNPKVLNDTIEDSTAVYGYKPSKEGSLKAYAECDWSNPEFVERARQKRIDYHVRNEVKIRDMVLTMRNQGCSENQIAKAVVEFRNQSRLSSYLNDKGTIIDQEGYYQAIKHCKTYEQMKLEGKTNEDILKSAIRGNPGMDACTGLYDDYYDQYSGEK